MNTADLINEIAEEFDLTKAKSKKIVSFALDRIMTEVRKGKTARLTGFGSFFRHKRNARTGRNPQNGDHVQIPACRVPKFKAGKIFKELVE